MKKGSCILGIISGGISIVLTILCFASFEFDFDLIAKKTKMVTFGIPFCFGCLFFIIGLALIAYFLGKMPSSNQPPHHQVGAPVPTQVTAPVPPQYNLEPAPQNNNAPDPKERAAKLKSLFEQGLITEEEFQNEIMKND